MNPYGALRRIEYLVRNGRDSEAQELAAGLPPDAPQYAQLAQALFDARALRWPDSLAAAEGAAKLASEAGDRAVEAWAITLRASGLTRTGRSAESLAVADSAAAVAEQANDNSARARALATKALALRRLDRYDESLAPSAHAVLLARQAGDAEREAGALLGKGWSLALLERYEESLDACAQAEALCTDTDDADLKARVLLLRAAVLPMLDRTGEALVAAVDAEDLYGQTADRVGRARATAQRAVALGALGAGDDSLTAADESTALATEVGDEVLQLEVASARADVLLRLGRHGEALSAAEEVAAMACRLGDKLMEANALRSQARAFDRLERHADAAELATRAADLYGLIGRPRDRAQALFVVTRALAGAGDREEAQASAEEASRLWPEGALLGAAAMEEIDPAQLKAEQDREEARFLQCLAREPVWDSPLPEGAEGSLLILRDWASFSTIPLAREAASSSQPTSPLEPLTTGAISGGYFLGWREKGIAVDPGTGFLAAMDACGLVLRNIDAVVITHYHFDHADDVLQLLSLLHETKEWQQMAGPAAGLPRLQPPFYVSPSCADALGSLVWGATNQGVTRLSTGAREPLVVLGERLGLAATPARHLDLTKRTAPADDASETVGVRIDLRDSEGSVRCRLGITGDTGWCQAVSDAFTQPPPVDILILHLGQVYRQDCEGSDAYAESHLGLNGASRLLQDVDAAHNEPWLAVVSEWGQQVAAYRTQICRFLESKLVHGRVIPGERGLQVALPQGQPVCQICRTAFATKWFTSLGQRITYVCDKHLTDVTTKA